MSRSTVEGIEVQLAQLRLRNFRSCEESVVELAPDLTLLVGENASGKSAVVDALRLVTYPASGRQSAWFSAERDLSFGAAKGESVEIAATYDSLTNDENAVYLAQLVDPDDTLTYRASFATSSAVPRRSALTWSVGAARMEDSEPVTRRRIAHVYLPPLRDAVRDLDGSEGSQLHEVIRILLAGHEEDEIDFLNASRAALDEIARHQVATRAKETIQEYFSKTTPPQREHRVELNPRDLALHRVTRLLRLQLAEAQVPLGDIASTGLGYANLLYIAMVVLGLVRAAEYDLTLLLVEEPEAHLHPQLQLVLLDFLKQQAADSGRKDQGLTPTGRVQVIATTHSPNLASAVSIENVVVISRTVKGARWSTAATSLRGIGLTPVDVRKIDRYLNATRAALLFGRHVILVEGVAEMMLLPAFARKHLAAPSNASREESDAAASRLRQFRNATLISVEGVDFEPYLHLLLDGSNPRADKVVVVTDRDKDGSGDLRKSSYETSFTSAAESGALVVCVGGTTLEAELFRTASNEALLRTSYLVLHPRSESKWNTVAGLCGTDEGERARVFARALSGKDDDVPDLDISKGDFAHLVAEALDADGEDKFLVPAYLLAAIEAVTPVVSAQEPTSGQFND